MDFEYQEVEPRSVANLLELLDRGKALAGFALASKPRVSAHYRLVELPDPEKRPQGRVHPLTYRNLTVLSPILALAEARKQRAGARRVRPRRLTPEATH